MRFGFQSHDADRAAVDGLLLFCRRQGCAPGVGRDNPVTVPIGVLVSPTDKVFRHGVLL